MKRKQKAATEQEQDRLLQQEATAPTEAEDLDSEDRVYVPMSGRRIAVLVALVLVAGITLGYAGFYFYSRAMREKIYTQLQQEVAAATATTPVPTVVPIAVTMEESEELSVPEGTIEEAQAQETEGTIVPEQEASSVPTPEPTPEPEPEPYTSPIDFEALWKINEDVIAWIEIPGTKVNYPILQHKFKDNYYLDITIDGGQGLPGSLYVFSHQDKNFCDWNTVVYGHNMKDDTMFGGFTKYRNVEGYMEARRSVIVYTPECERHYTIFGEVVYDDRLITQVYDETKQEDRQAFLDSLTQGDVEGTRMLDDIEVTPDSRIITLSCCINELYRHRQLLVAVEDPSLRLPRGYS